MIFCMRKRWRLGYIVCSHNFKEDTDSSVENTPPPKKSNPISNEIDASLSSNGGNPQVLTYSKSESYNLTKHLFIRKS